MSDELKYRKKLKNDIFLLAGILLVALLALSAIKRYRKTGTVCIVWLEGKEYARLSLSEDSLTEVAGCKIRVSNGSVFMEEADCKGLDCVHMKPVSEEGQVIACLPNRLVLEIKGNNECHTVTYLDVFDTVTTITAYTVDANEFAALSDRIHSELVRYHRLFDIYHEYSELYNACSLNRETGDRLNGIKVREGSRQIPAELYNLLKKSVEFYNLTDGRVNIAMGPVLSKWHEAREYSLENPDKAYVPDYAELTALREHCGIENLVLKQDNYILVSDIEASFDLGAVAKGYATEMVAQMLEKDGYTGILLNVGGNVRAVGAPPKGAWNIAIESSESSIAGTVRVTHEAVVTSGDYQRFYTVNGKKYCHIIDSETLYPAENCSSATVICDDSGLADALSTALFIMKPDEAIAFAETLEDVEALIVRKDGTVLKTSGFASFEITEDKP